MGQEMGQIIFKKPENYTTIANRLMNEKCSMQYKKEEFTVDKRILSIISTEENRQWIATLNYRKGILQIRPIHQSVVSAFLIE